MSSQRTDLFSIEHGMSMARAMRWGTGGLSPHTSYVPRWGNVLLYEVGEACFGAFEFGFHGGAKLGDAVCVGGFADEVF